MATAVVVRIVETANRPRPCFTGTIMIAGDMLAISATIALALVVRGVSGGQLEAATYMHLWPLLGLFPIAYALFGLYPGVALSPVTEIGRASCRERV